ncbi:hypothetical protein [Syntrophomonas curvata]
MQIVIQKGGITFIGQVKDLPSFFKGIPAHITLQEFIHRNLH